MKFYTSVQQSGNSILVRGCNEGKRFQERVKYNPTLFTSCKDINTGWKTLDNRPVQAVKQGNISNAKEFINTYKDIEGFKIYGQTRYLNQYIFEEYPEEIIKFSMKDIRVFNIDIETAAENGFPDIESADQEILAISIKDSDNGRIIVFGSRPFDNKDPQVDYLEFQNEYNLLNAFISWWSSNLPDVITGWNIQLFDVPYILHRIERIFGEKEAKLLSPWKSYYRCEIWIKGKKNIAYDISGISQLDYLELYKKFTYTNQESYRLDYIAFVELGQQKLDHSEFDTFKEFYTNNWQKFIEYNIHDVRLVDRIDDKKKLLELAIQMAYDAKVNYEDVFSQVRMWDNIIYVDLARKGIVIPPKEESSKDDKYAGAYVKQPEPGMYDWVVSFDLNSLYPHLIMQYNISPETLMPTRHPSANVVKLLEREIDTTSLQGQALAPNGTLYDTSRRGFLPELMDRIYTERVVYKKKMKVAQQQYEKSPSLELKKEIDRCNNIQMARKIQLNSAYGAIGCQHFRYFKVEMAEAITLAGQLSIKWIVAGINDYLNKLSGTDNEDYVIACDTDSMYLNLGNLVKRVYEGKNPTTDQIVTFLDKFADQKLEQYIEETFQKLADYCNAYEQKMKMKRENISERGFWTAKKRYALKVWDSEGVRYTNAKNKICGLSSVSSATPSFYRERFTEAYDIILNKDNDAILAYIKQVKQECKEQGQSIISFNKGCNNIKKYSNRSTLYEKGCPIQVKAAILYNYHVRKLKLEHKYPLIQEGEKIKYAYLKEPNPIGQPVIGFYSEIPKEFELEDYVDHYRQYNTAFKEPMEKLLDIIGWESKKKHSLLNKFYK